MAKLTGQQLLSALGKTGALVSPSATVTKSVIRSFMLEVHLLLLQIH